ncbi:MAG: hypothetical protein K1X92_16320 [Bacteroidia bacterium]|nr:hypothetical protein [Bacteroidia bacterium]
MKFYFRVFLIFTGYIISFFEINGQTRDLDSLKIYRNADIRIGLGLTGNQYIGDLSSKNPWEYPRVNSGVNLSFLSQKKSALNLLVNIGTGAIVGQNDSVKFTEPLTNKLKPNRFVSTTFIYGDVNARLRFFKNKKLQPYAGAGAGFIFYSPKNEKSVGLLDQERTRISGENYSLIMLQFPLRAGLDYQFSRIAGLNLSYQHRFLSSDYLDNIGKLGSRKGNDYLQSIELALVISLNPPKPTSKVKIYKPVENDTIKVDTLLVTDRFTDSLKKEGFTVVPDIPEEENYFGMLNAGIDWLNQIGKGLQEEEDAGNSAGWTESVESDEYGWLWKYLEEKAIKENRFIEYKCNPGETYFSLYERFRVSTTTILILNGIAGSSIPPYDKAIVIPDTEKWLQMFPDIDRIIRESGATPPK